MIDYNCQRIDKEYIESLYDLGYKVDVDKINYFFRSYLVSPYFKMLNSGTSSLMLSLRSLNIPFGKKILGPSYAHPAWLNSARFLGYCNIGFVDIKKETLSMNPEELEKQMDNDIGVVFFVNKNGYIGQDLLDIRDICDRYNVPLIEDSCNAFGQEWNGIKAGTVGDIGCYSFGTPKILTSGEGGAITTKNKESYNNIDEMSWQGGWYKNDKKKIGYGGNFVVPNVTRILLYEQLKDIYKLQEQRHSLFMIYKNNIKNGYLHEYPTDKNMGYPMNILLDGDIKNTLSKANMLKIDIRKGIYRSLGRFYGVKCEVSEHIEETALFLPVYIKENDAKIVSEIT